MSITGLAKLMSSNEPKRLTQSYRRNGKLQSCEPCRKGKLRCDHMLPHCSRCTRRKVTDKCVYHPAPMTKSKSSLRDASGPSSERAVATSTPVSNARASHSVHLYASPASTPVGSEALDATPDHDSAGFLGLTSFSSIWDENRTRLGIDSAEQASAVYHAVPEDKMLKGVEVLSLLRDLSFFKRCINRWYAGGGGGMLIEPMVRQWMIEMETTWSRVLRTWQSDEAREMSRKVWINSQTRLVFDGRTSAKDWLSMFSGENLRWEAVGLIYTIVGHLCMSLIDSDPLFETFTGDVFNRKQYSRRSCMAAEMCSTFCKDIRVVNDASTWLLFENCILTSRFVGRTSYVTWQMYGELMHSLIMLGLHQKIEANEKTPFFLAELRKRCFLFCYTTDKNLATFLGRPPRLSKRYCLIQLPVDIPDEQMMDSSFEVASVKAQSDDNGWNIENRLNRATIARVYALIADIREDILELSLGVLPIEVEDMIRRAASIQAHADSIDAELPEFLRTDPTLIDSHHSPEEALLLIYLRIQYYEHSFLLQRTLVKRAGVEGTELTRVAKQILRLCLIIVNRRDMMRDFQVDIASIVHGFGIPAAATVAVHLHHFDQHPGPENDRVLPRSETIQELCVFTSYLATAPRDDGMSSIAQQGHTFLKRFLDKILSPSRTVEPPVSTILPTLEPPGLGCQTCDVPTPSDSMVDQTFSLSLPSFPEGTDAEFVTWLDSIDWEGEAASVVMGAAV